MRQCRWSSLCSLQPTGYFDDEPEPDSEAGAARDLEPMIGSRGRVSEILNRKRALSMAMVWRLHHDLGIAAESQVA